MFLVFEIYVYFKESYGVLENKNFKIVLRKNVTNSKA